MSADEVFDWGTREWLAREWLARVRRATRWADVPFAIAGLIADLRPPAAFVEGWTTVLGRKSGRSSQSAIDPEAMLTLYLSGVRALMRVRSWHGAGAALARALIATSSKFGRR